MSSNRNLLIDGPDSIPAAAAEAGITNTPDLLSLARRSRRNGPAPSDTTLPHGPRLPNDPGPPAAAPEGPPEAAAPRRNPTFWSSFFDWLTDGFVFDGAVIDPTLFIPLNLHDAAHPRPFANDILAPRSVGHAAADA